MVRKIKYGKKKMKKVVFIESVEAAVARGVKIQKLKPGKYFTDTPSRRAPKYKGGGLKNLKGGTLWG